MSALPKRTFYSLVIVLLWLGFVVDGAHAIFSNAAFLNGNTITSGTASLLISNSQGLNPTDFSSSQPGFSYRMTPGETEDRYIYLRNASDDPINFDLYLTASNSGTDSNEAMFSAVQVTIYPVDSNGNVIGTAFQSTLMGLINPTITGFEIAQGETQRFLLKTTLAMTWDQQNDTTAYNLAFTGTQDIGN